LTTWCLRVHRSVSRRPTRHDSCCQQTLAASVSTDQCRVGLRDSRGSAVMIWPPACPPISVASAYATTSGQLSPARKGVSTDQCRVGLRDAERLGKIEAKIECPPISVASAYATETGPSTRVLSAVVSTDQCRVGLRDDRNGTQPTKPLSVHRSVSRRPTRPKSWVIHRPHQKVSTDQCRVGLRDSRPRNRFKPLHLQRLQRAQAF